jgi:O-acetyl-ADP-ribose deacetylase (regulator of RNase III)
MDGKHSTATFTLSLIRGDITAQEVDVITNAANEGLNHGAGLAKAIVDKGGE